MFGAIFGYGVILLLTKTLPNLAGVGGPFGPQENSIVQASATGAGGMAGVFVAGLPAMYRLGLLSDDPKSDFPRILTITIICAFFGLFAAVPLRKFFIINVARELNMVFPTPTATALAIRSMHAVGSGAADAMKKIKALATPSWVPSSTLSFLSTRTASSTTGTSSPGSTPVSPDMNTARLCCIQHADEREQGRTTPAGR